MNDQDIFKLISKEGLTASPGNAITEVMYEVHYVANVCGEYGGFRDFADLDSRSSKLEESIFALNLNSDITEQSLLYICILMCIEGDHPT